MNSPYVTWWSVLRTKWNGKNTAISPSLSLHETILWPSFPLVLLSLMMVIAKYLRVGSVSRSETRCNWLQTSECSPDFVLCRCPPSDRVEPRSPRSGPLLPSEIGPHRHATSTSTSTTFRPPRRGVPSPDTDPVYMGQLKTKFRMDKFDKRNKRKFWLMKATQTAATQPFTWVTRVKTFICFAYRIYPF